MDLTGGGAFYSLTPRRILADLGINELKANPPYPPLGKGGRKVAFTLAEGATHVDTFHDIRKPAFTLAEVLVTLGIIGIVAAMTMPMLANKYQWFVRQQQFKKAYAALNIAVQKTQIDMGEGVRCYYLMAQNYTVIDKAREDCDYFYSEFTKNLQLIKTCKGNALKEGCITNDYRGGDEVYSEVQGGDNPDEAKDFFNNNCPGYNISNLQNKSFVYMTNSGFSIIPYYSDAYLKTSSFLVDINGLQKPNKWGHDIYIFSFQKKKKYDSVFTIAPHTGCHALDYGGVYTKHFVEYLYGQNSEDLGSVHKNL